MTLGCLTTRSAAGRRPAAAASSASTTAAATRHEAFDRGDTWDGVEFAPHLGDTRDGPEYVPAEQTPLLPRLSAACPRVAHAHSVIHVTITVTAAAVVRVAAAVTRDAAAVHVSAARHVGVAMVAAAVTAAAAAVHVSAAGRGAPSVVADFLGDHLAHISVGHATLLHHHHVIHHVAGGRCGAVADLFPPHSISLRAFLLHGHGTTCAVECHAGRLHSRRTDLKEGKTSE